jgi:hypothetical protein
MEKEEEDYKETIVQAEVTYLCIILSQDITLFPATLTSIEILPTHQTESQEGCGHRLIDFTFIPPKSPDYPTVRRVCVSAHTAAGRIYIVVIYHIMRL